MKKIIPYGKHEILEEDIQGVVKTLRSDFLTNGPKIDQFEKDFSKYVGSKYAVAVSSGTAALHLCVLAMELQKNDHVVTTPITFVASANCIRYCDGNVVFSDIDPNSFLLDLDKLELLLENQKSDKIKGIISVNFAGRVIDLERLRKLADKHNLWIIEDACHSPGGYFVDLNNNHQLSGNGRFADLSIFSFHPVKHIASGEGGIITTNNLKLYERLKTLRNHGITKNVNDFINTEKMADYSSIGQYPKWYMEMQILGFNYRISDINCSLGITQLKKAKIRLNKRIAIAKRYNEAFKNKKYVVRQSGFVKGHAYHLYIIQVENRFELYNYLREKGIHCQIHYFPCHLMPYYKKMGWKENDFKNAENYYKKCMSLPIYPSLSKKDQTRIIEKINNFYNE